MLDAAILAIIEEAGVNVLILTEGLEEAEFLSTRLTREEVKRQIGIMAGVAGKLSDAIHAELPEVDWEGWAVVAKRMDQEADDALWFSVRSLVPATLMWLRVCRRSRPELFACKPS